MPLKDTRQCPKCQGPVRDSCIDQGHIGPLPVLPLNIEARSTGQSTSNTPANPTPRCPTCTQKIRPECLINSHIVPCRACGLSFAYRPRSSDGLTEPSYLDWAYRDAMRWLVSQTGQKAESETTNTAEKSSKADQASAASTGTAPEPAMHVCIARKLQRKKEDGERRGVRIAGHLEWEMTLDSLREMTPLAEEVPAAVRALAALKEECDATYAMLEFVRKCDPAGINNS